MLENLTMYREHVPIINVAMRADLSTFKRGVMFAVLSARTQFSRISAQCEELRQSGAKAKCLWSLKIDAYNYLEEHGEAIWHNVCEAKNTRNALWAITRIPGMGVVKGAFVLQMLGHDIACLDVRNILADGRLPREYRSDGEVRKTRAAFLRKIDRYLLDTKGKAEHYWNSWCNTVGPDYGMTGEQCSWLHVTTIVPKRLRRPIETYNLDTESCNLDETF